MADDVAKELIALVHDWDRAMVENDADAIGRYMADDWRIVGTDGGVNDKPSMLALIRAGTLETERSSNVFVRPAGRWRCVLTHLSRLASTVAMSAAILAVVGCRKEPAPRPALASVGITVVPAGLGSAEFVVNRDGTIRGAHLSGDSVPFVHQVDGRLDSAVVDSL